MASVLPFVYTQLANLFQGIHDEVTAVEMIPILRCEKANPQDKQFRINDQARSLGVLLIKKSVNRVRSGRDMCASNVATVRSQGRMQPQTA